MHNLDKFVEEGAATLRQGIRNSILVQRMHGSDPQRDDSLLMSRPQTFKPPHDSAPDTGVLESHSTSDATADMEAVGTTRAEPEEAAAGLPAL